MSRRWIVLAKHDMSPGCGEPGCCPDTNVWSAVTAATEDEAKARAVVEWTDENPYQIPTPVHVMQIGGRP